MGSKKMSEPHQYGDFPGISPQVYPRTSSCHGPCNESRFISIIYIDPATEGTAGDTPHVGPIDKGSG